MRFLYRLQNKKAWSGPSHKNWWRT
jgi:hypothetical protein